jgi:MoaA/NifB/PqqE/SkfB family radical SAM enzyme
MNIPFDARIFSFYNEIKGLNAGEFPYPRFLALYPTNMCQFNCTFCDYKELNACKPEFLKGWQWQYILKGFKNIGGEAVGLAGGGEPLMLPTIEEFLRKANDLGLAVAVVTNGLNIDKKNRRELYDLLLETCTFIRVSFEAGTEDKFKKIKGKDSFSRIINNVWDLIDDSEGSNLQVSYKYTISSDYNFEDIAKAIGLANDLKFHSIQFKAVCNAEGRLKAKARNILTDFITSQNASNTKIICDLDLYKKRNDGCRICGIQTLIDYHGDVYLCCYYRHRLKEHKVGNVFDTKFKDIWGSTEHAKKMEEVDFRKCNLYDCRYIRYDHIMRDVIKSNYLSFI